MANENKIERSTASFSSDVVKVAALKALAAETLVCLEETQENLLRPSPGGIVGNRLFSLQLERAFSDLTVILNEIKESGALSGEKSNKLKDMLGVNEKLEKLQKKIEVLCIVAARLVQDEIAEVTESNVFCAKP